MKKLGDKVDFLVQNEVFLTIVYYIAAIAAIIIALIVFELVTKYKNWEQIRKGNVSVAMATAGKIFGVANIFRFSIEHNDTMLQTFTWAAIGYVLLVAAYFIFEFLMPKFNVDREIEKDNRAVGFIAMILSIALSYVVGASIM